jgi:hypothetical protein
MLKPAADLGAADLGALSQRSQDESPGLSRWSVEVQRSQG